MKRKQADVLEAGEVLCPGDSNAFGAKMRNEAHVAVKPHPDCMNCHAPLGCVRCSGITKELLCMRCRNWGHRDALEEHGRMLSSKEERAEGLAFLRSLTGALTGGGFKAKFNSQPSPIAEDLPPVITDDDD